jgi:alpha-tubulin suppressor-like RCC1 family protein
VGQLGDGSWDIVTEPVAVLGLHDIFRIAGESPTCAVTLNGRLFCWGPNEDGQVGDGTTEHRNVAVEIPGI